MNQVMTSKDEQLDSIIASVNELQKKLAIQPIQEKSEAAEDENLSVRHAELQNRLDKLDNQVNERMR